MFKSNFSKCLSFLALIAVFVSVAAQQSDQQSQPAPEITAAAVTPTPAAVDNATINLHRWGAVTLFHGLPSDRVNAITEDASGVLWFGTDTGLVRYDGRNVEAAPNEAALPSRRILALKLDHRGRLWIGTDAGAARLMGNRIEVLPETRGRAVSGIAFSQQGEAAVVTSAGEIIRYREQVERDQGARETSRIASSYINSSDSNTAVTLVGKLDPNAHPLLKSPKQPGAILPLAAIIPGSSGDWLIGSTGRGLLINHENDLREASTRTPRPYFVSSIYDDGTRVWLAEQASARAGGLWFWKDGAFTRTSFQTGPLTAVAGGDGELWVGSAKQGAFLLRYENGGVKVIEHLTFDNTAGGLRSDRINAIFRDREGVVWFGSDRGVCRYDRSSFRASTISGNPQSNYVRTILHASNGETWLGTNRGLFRLASGGESSASGGSGASGEGDSDSWVEIPDLDGRSIYALTEDNGAIWVGAVGGLFVKSKGASNFSRVLSATEASTSAATGANEAEQPAPPETRQTETQPATQEQATQKPEGAGSYATKEIVRAIAGFRGQIYAAFYESRIERVNTTASGFTRAPAFTDAGAKRATCMAVERQNGADAALWYGTADGELRRFDGSRTAAFALPQKQQAADRGIRALAVTERGVWIGSAQGLYLREGDSIREIRPDVDVWSLLVTREAAPKSGDDAPREVVWIATKNAGLIKLLPYQGGISARFDTEQGLPSQQVFALAPGDNGEVWIGTNRGVARHRPSQIEPRLQIRRLVTPDRIVFPEELTAEVSLSHTTRSLLLEVAGISSKTLSSQFQYEFARLDQNGNEEKKLQSAPQFAVENLQSGSYTIVARAVSRDLIYSAPLNVRLQIRSAPFPWRTVLLATLLAIAVAAAAMAFRQQFRLASANRALEKTNIELTETRLRLANETEKERSRIARDLHDQTLADLRRLLVMTDQLANGAPPALSSDSHASDPPSSDAEDSTPSPAALRREIEAISSGIRHICEDLSPSALENIGFLPALEWALSNAVAQLPAHEKFTYEFICDASLEDRLRLSDIERIQLYRIVQEALNNVARHARAKQVKMEVRAENPADLVIEIRDDGVGFDGAIINKTGHGIANIRSRANLIGAKAEWKNSYPGCRFEIRKEGSVE